MSGQPIERQLSREEKLYATATAQAGYFTAKQATEAGYGQSLHSHHTMTRKWERVGTGLYRLRTLPLTLDDQYVRLSLWSRDQKDRPQGVFGFETAMALHDLSDLMPSRLHMIVPPTFRKHPLPGLVLHKASLPSKDIQRRSAYRVTTPLRTLIDLAGSFTSAEHLHLGLAQALDRGLIRRRTLEQRLADLTIPSLARRRLLVILEDL